MEKKNNEGIRINKYISDYGFCSRREADKLIEDERVTINNRLATPGDKVTENDNIRIDGEHLAYIPREARPKKHRWGPPRNTDSNEEQPTRRSGQRGSVRNAKPQSKPSTATLSATKNKNNQSKKSIKTTGPKRK